MKKFEAVSGDQSLFDLVDDGWISVDDEMPTHDEEVIVYANGFVHGGYTYSKYSGHFLDASYDSLHDVTHWMPLPEGPKK